MCELFCGLTGYNYADIGGWDPRLFLWKIVFFEIWIFLRRNVFIPMINLCILWKSLNWSLHWFFSVVSPLPLLTFPSFFVTALIMAYNFCTSVGSLWFWSSSLSQIFSVLFSCDGISVSSTLIYWSLLIDFAKSILCASLIVRLALMFLSI